MWLPKPLYDALPAIYVLVGLLFLCGAIYLGLVHEASPAYAGVGMVCILSGLLVRRLRTRQNDDRPPKPVADDAADR